MSATLTKKSKLTQESLFGTTTRIGNETTFTGNMSSVIHRWFRYSAGFSAAWAEAEIRKHHALGLKTVLDPFAGSGTTLIAADASGTNSIGVESHPFVSRIAAAKLLWGSDVDGFIESSKSVLENAKRLRSRNYEYPTLIQNCFPDESLTKLDSLRFIIEKLNKTNPSSSSELIWLALTAILRECSPVGTAQWQYVLPNKSKANWKDPYDAFAQKISIMALDMSVMQNKHGKRSRAQVIKGDARTMTEIPDGVADFVLTSPPYANNYDYADAVRLEMSFFNIVTGWGDLQNVVRKHLIRSCTQHVATLNGEIDEILSDSVLLPIRNELIERYQKLEVEKESHGGKKPYHKMAAAYFYDLAKVWIALRRVTALGGKVCFVIGDSAPYGVHLPVERWLGELAIAAGFSSYRFDQTRLRNIKWKNRKHSVPLQEGMLWVNG